MREGFDKEIDSLLRRTARAPTGARGNGAGASRPDSHLDADELAAFAEGALPEAARMSAVSHLADCGECRTHAVNLTRAAGVEAKLEKSAAGASSTARESKPARGWLAALFAPRALRYVAPAFALCLVAAVSFVALRSRSDRGLVSLQESNRAGARTSITTTHDNSQPLPEAPSTSGGASANANASPATTGASEAPRDDKSAADTYVPKPENKDAKEDAPDGSAASTPAKEKSVGADAGAAGSPPPPAKEEEDKPASGAPAPTEMAKSAPSDNLPAPKYAEQHMKAGPPPSPAQNNDEVASNEQSQKRAGQQRGLEVQSPDGGARNQSRAAANNSASGGALAGAMRDDRESSVRRESPPAAKRGRSGQDADSSAGRTNTVEESRSVAGHRFRRDGDAWVDVNYKTSMSSTGVRRGTDAYRGLVADIPELGRIAEALGGEVLVVVRGRAYRIR